MTQALPHWHTAIEAETPEPSLRRVVMASLVTIGVGFGGFFAWAFTAPLDSAVPAPATIVVEGKRKTVSLLDSGILTELLVREGDHVVAGQPLLRLDDTQALAQAGQLRAQRWAARSRAARLQAEQNGDRDLTFPPDLMAAAEGDRTVAALLDSERRLFDVRWRTYDGLTAVAERRIAQLREQTAAYTAQKEATSARLEYTEDELRGYLKLLAKGFVPRNKVLELKRVQAEMKGNIGELAAKELEAAQTIAHTELELVSTRNTRMSEIGKELQETLAAVNDVAERLRAAEDLLSHKVVPAPESGAVTDIKFSTTGSSIGAGQPIMDIVPQGQRLLVEAAIDPNDIEHVHVGQPVNVRLTAFKQHKVPVLTGRVVYVSADRQLDPKGEPFFLARAELDAEALAGLEQVKLYPGMPAEALIIGGERTAMDYIISPITDGMRRSLRER